MNDVDASVFIFFFSSRRRHTRYWRDWSSDVCSSDLERQGYLNRSDGKLELSPKAVRRLGATALRRVFAQLDATGRGEHDVADAGAAGELTGSSREWRVWGGEPPGGARAGGKAAPRAPGAPPARPTGRAH